MRVPLGGRRVRGYVVEVGHRPPDRLRQIQSVSGDLPVFDRELLDVLLWAAHHYVAPVSVLLGRAGPPNLPRSVRCPSPSPPPPTAPVPELEGWVRRAKDGDGPNLLYQLERSGEVGWLRALVPPVARGRSVLVVAPTEVEAGRLGEYARGLGVPAEVVTSQLADRETTSAWARTSECPGSILIGTPRVALWPVAGLAALVAVEEGRRAMKERQTPTLAVRELFRRRALRRRIPLLFVGPTPSVEALSIVSDVTRSTSSRRLWSHVEVIDRRADQGLLTLEVRRAVAATVAAGKEVFLFSHRRGYAPASRCVSCGTVRRCPGCGSRPDRGDECARCGATLGPCPDCGGRRFQPLGAGVGRVAEEARRIVGGDVVVTAPRRGPVTVGSERDLPHIGRPALAVVVDADGLILATHYRAAEEALRIMARVAATVSSGSGSRTMIQTALPDHSVITALRRGDPLTFLRREMAERARFGYPPAGELLVVEMRGGDPGRVEAEMAAAGEGVSVLGPAETPGGRRWLVQGVDLTGFRRLLRPRVQAWRDAGATVRIDADPIDL